MKKVEPIKWVDLMEKDDKIYQVGKGMKRSQVFIKTPKLKEMEKFPYHIIIRCDQFDRKCKKTN